jgi:hypothetical protein
MMKGLESLSLPGIEVRFLAFIRLLFRTPYRETEGFVRFLSKHIEGLRVPDYNIDRVVNKLDIDLDEFLIRSNTPVTIAVDTSGVKVHKGGDWFRCVWTVKEGYLKNQFVLGIKTKQVVSMNVFQRMSMMEGG